MDCAFIGGGGADDGGGAEDDDIDDTPAAAAAAAGGGGGPAVRGYASETRSAPGSSVVVAVLREVQTTPLGSTGQPSLVCLYLEG